MTEDQSVLLEELSLEMVAINGLLVSPSGWKSEKKGAVFSWSLDSGSDAAGLTFLTNFLASLITSSELS